MWRTVARLLGIALPIYFAWEMLQMPAFAGVPDDWVLSTAVCALATIGDAVMVLFLLGFGQLLFRERRWFLPVRPARYVAVTLVAIAIQIPIEWIAVDHLRWWSYAGSHPRIPGLGTGLVPLLQAAIVPPLVFWLTAVWERCVALVR